MRRRSRRDEDEVLDDVLTLERWGVVEPCEQPAGEQRERREDADELACEQVDRYAQPAPGDEQQADGALEACDEHDRGSPGSRPNVSVSVVFTVSSSRG